jgi:saccharopine dehydrogenase (NAD+, L-lysine-forming)
MSNVLIVGAGGVGRVVAHKCAQVDAFEHICLASRTRSKCDRIAESLPRSIQTAEVDADSVAQTVALIQRVRPDVLINVALPYQDLTLMEACLETGVHYLDTANYEPREEARFTYEYQWPYHERFAGRGLMALLGSGFDPGATNVFCAYAQKHWFDEIHSIDIQDCNGGDHGLPFATNFNPEINLREITAPGRYWEDGQWKEVPALSVHQPFDFPEIGEREMYLIYHEEMESLVRHVRGLRRIRFWMTFSEKYLTHLQVLQNVGLTRIDPILFQGQAIVPLEFLKALLPDPASLGPLTKGKTNIGCIFEGTRRGEPVRKYIYNVCDHEAAYAETGAQAISYTTGVPAMIGALLMCNGVWMKPGVYNIEQLDPDPFMDLLMQHGLPWTVV